MPWILHSKTKNPSAILTKSIAAWEAVHALARRADGQVVEAATDLLASDDCRQRVCGADIFGQFPQGRWMDERFALLSAALESEVDARAITALVHSTGHLPDPRILGRLLELLVIEAAFLEPAERAASFKRFEASPAGDGALVELLTREVLLDRSARRSPSVPDGY